MKKDIETMMEFATPFQIRTMLIQGDETGINNLIDSIVEKRKISAGSQYSRYSKAITALRSVLKEVQTNNALKMLIRTNKEYGNSYVDYDDCQEFNVPNI